MFVSQMSWSGLGGPGEVAVLGAPGTDGGVLHRWRHSAPPVAVSTSGCGENAP